MTAMIRARRLVDRALGVFLAAAMAVAVAVVLWQVASRYLLGDPSPWSEELVRYLLIWIGLLGGAYAAGQRMHLAIDLLPRRLEPGRAARLGRLCDLLVAAFALAVLVIGGAALVRLSWRLGQTTAALGVPLGWVYLALPVAGALIVFYSLAGRAGEAGEAPR